MKRKLLLAFLIVLIPSLCFAAVNNASFILNQAAEVLDLASSDYPSHSDAAYYLGQNSTPVDPYYDSQIIGSYEFRNTNNNSGYIRNVAVSVELISGNQNDGWYLTYSKDGTTYKRPFSIIINGREEKLYYYTTTYYRNFNPVSRLTIGDSASSKNYTKYTLSRADKSQLSNSSPAYIWDIILVFDKSIDRSTNTVEDTAGIAHNLISSGDGYYEALLRVSLTYETSNTKNGTYSTKTQSSIVWLRGTYNATNPHSNTTSNITSTLNVSRMASAESLNIASLIEKGTATKTNVGTYNFKAINTGGNDSTRSFSLFLSSSSVGTTAGSEFMFKQVDSSGRVSSFATNHNAIKFYAYMTSQKTNATAEFHGQDVYTSSLSGSSITISGVHDTTYNYTKWEDYGDISIAIPSGQTINGAAVTAETLISGRYVGNIYIHVVSNP